MVGGHERSVFLVLGRIDLRRRVGLASKEKWLILLHELFCAHRADQTYAADKALLLRLQGFERVTAAGSSPSKVE
jgi:hypothetical protein